jgi:WD40 repeat protein
MTLVTTCADGYVRVWDARSGVLLAEPMHNQSELLFKFSAQFSSDGEWMVVTTPSRHGQYHLCVWQLPVARLPVPTWIPEFAEALGGQRLDETGMIHPVPWQRLLELQKQFGALGTEGFYDRWMRWFVDGKPTRKISPRSNFTVLEYAQDRIQENTVESLREAVRLVPTNALAFARLARQLLAQDDPDNLRRLGEADLFSRHAVELAPHDAGVAKIRKEIVTQIEALKKP